MRGKPRQHSNTLFETAVLIIGKIAFIAALGLAAGILYYAYALSASGVREYKKYPHPEQMKILANLHGAEIILLTSAVIVLIYVLTEYWQEEGIGWWLTIFGASLHFGSPFFLADSVGRYGNNPAIAAVQHALTTLGQLLLVGAAIRIGPVLVHEIIAAFSGVGEDSPSRAAAEQLSGNMHPLSPCWCLPYCRPYIRKNCVRYKEKSTCWRKKKGCMCDDDIMAAALMGGNYTPSSAREKLILEYIPGADVRQKGVVAKRLKCQNCFIYLEHQRIKHKFIAPLSLPILSLVFWLLRGPIGHSYDKLCAVVKNGVTAIALGEMDFRAVEETLTNPVVKYLILFCVGMYAVTYVLRFLEYMFFKLKI